MYIASLAGDMDGESEGTEYRQASPDPPICAEKMRFFTNLCKPMILALARPDPKKNRVNKSRDLLLFQKRLSQLLLLLTKAAMDEDDDSNVDLFGEETEEEKKAVEECAAAVKASGKKKEYP